MTSLAFFISTAIHLSLSLSLSILAYIYPESISLRGVLLGGAYGFLMMLGSWILCAGVLQKRSSSMLNLLFLIKVPLLIFFLILSAQDGEQGLLAFIISSLAALPATLCGAIFSQRQQKDKDNSKLTHKEQYIKSE